MRNTYQLAGLTQENKSVEYGSLPYNDHPIDTATQWQGFGPFEGAYNPWQFESAKDIVAPGGIDIYWTQGDNKAVNSVAPSYVLTLMRDNSLDYANNPGLSAVMMQNAMASSPNTSTASNASRVNATGVNPNTAGQHGYFSTLRDWLRSL